MSRNAITAQPVQTKLTRGAPLPAQLPIPALSRTLRSASPYSRAWSSRKPDAVLMVRLDGRTRHGQILQQVRRDLTEHVGGNPTAAQKMIIDRCAWISVRLDTLDRKLAAGEEFTLPDTNYYLAWSNALSRMLVKLGLRKPPPTIIRPRLADILAQAAANVG